MVAELPAGREPRFRQPEPPVQSHTNAVIRTQRGAACFNPFASI